ncbi:MAG: GTP-sensing pleiotropic transcriptional regulator CodY [Clostridiales bacterium]|nr:GTP-sensing pleiotropic transcriptional regulator CodY [Clostridiales bacterium]
MSYSLLDKTRRLNRIIQRSGSEPVRFFDLTEVLSQILDSNIYIVSHKGRMLGYSIIDDKCFKTWQVDMNKIPNISTKHNNQLLRTNETLANVNIEKDGLITESNIKNKFGKFSCIIPISGGGHRIGSLIVERLGEKYTDNDLVLAEYCATVAGMEIINAKAKEIEKEAREKAVVQMAIRTLSYSELEAIDHILNELDGNEGLLVASKIADRVGITRSVIVNALRKLESAGIIESRSLGMKGTHIKILNDKLLNELERNR